MLRQCINDRKFNDADLNHNKGLYVINMNKFIIVFRLCQQLIETLALNKTIACKNKVVSLPTMLLMCIKVALFPNGCNI